MVTWMNSVALKNPKIKVVDLRQALKFFHTHEPLISHIANVRREPDKKKKNILKLKGSAYALGVIFEDGLSHKHIKERTKVLFLDFDYDSDFRAREVKEFLIALFGKNAFYIAISPSGNGVHIYLYISNPDQRLGHWLSAKSLALERYGLVVDEATKDETRKTFLTHDVEAFFNENPEPYEGILDHGVINKPQTEISPATVPTEGTKHYSAEMNGIIAAAIKQNMEFVAGRRHQFTAFVAGTANTYGVPIDKALDFMFQNYKLDNFDDHLETFKDIYVRYEKEFGSRSFTPSSSSKSANVSKRNPLDPTEDDIEENKIENPYFADWVFYKLPSFLKPLFAHYREDQKRKRDICMASVLALVSGILPNVYGVHDKRRIFPNKFFMVIAPAASGKSEMLICKKLAEPIVNYLRGIHEEKLQEYKEALKEYRKASKDDPSAEEPKEPVEVKLFIAADTSSRGFINKLRNSEGKGILIDSESDLLSSSMDQKWGSSLSSMLRKIYEHEDVDVGRADAEILIQNPAISMLLSGTPGQVPRLIPSKENGLFSRIIFYYFYSELEWDESIFDPDGHEVLETTINEVGQHLFELYRFLNEKQEECEFTWSAAQGKEMSNFFKSRLGKLREIYEERVDDVVFRLGSVATKLGIDFSALRDYDEHKKVSTKLTCRSEDMELILHLIDIFIQHSFSVYENLISRDEKDKMTKTEARIIMHYEIMPTAFKREELLKIEHFAKMKLRTLDNHLKRLVDMGYLSSDGAGNYEKLK